MTYPTSVVALPIDSKIPPRRLHPGTSQAQVLRPYALGASDADEAVWCRWILGHQHLFVSWLIQADVCRRTSRALARNNIDTAAKHLHVLAELRYGEIGAMLNGGAMPPERYQSVLRPRMSAVRADFSARSAADYLALESAMTEFKQVSRDYAQQNHAAFDAALNEYRNANGAWVKHHLAVAERLQPGGSMAVMEHERLKQEGLAGSFNDYVTSVIQGREAMAQYDAFFGVERQEVTLEEFVATALWLITQMHKLLDVPMQQLKWLLNGDALLIAHLEALMAERVSTDMAMPRLEIDALKNIVRPKKPR